MLEHKTKMNTDNDILIRASALLDGITPGEWKESDDGECFGSITANVYRNRADDGYDYYIDMPDKDAAFIAAAPTLVRELCAEVERLRLDYMNLKMTTYDQAHSSGANFGYNNCREEMQPLIDEAERQRDRLATALGQSPNGGICRFPGDIDKCIWVVGAKSCKRCWLDYAARKDGDI